jgi:hypothetical protein
MAARRSEPRAVSSFVERTAFIAARRTRLALLSLLVAAVGLVFWTGCASTVRPPVGAKDPITVRLYSTGRHAGLLLPCSEGRTVEYGYGDWDWYALAKNGWWRAPATVLWPNQGTLGRRYLRGEDLAAMGDTYGAGSLALIRVPREAAGRLLARLDAEFVAGGEPHFNRLYDMWFVKHPDRFWFLHDCHDEVTGWLRELGCSVSWAPIRLGLAVEKPQG